MLKSKIRNKEKTVGMYVQLSDISIAKIAGLAGYDFIWIDTEHSYLSYETVLAQIMAIRTTETPVIVRVPQNDLTSTKKILEMGVDGVIFPMVKDPEEIEKLIDYTLYPPYGERGFGPMNAIDYGLKSTGDYIKKSRDEMCRFIQIEHKDAISNLDKIMRNPYIDGYIFGPNDLSGSYDMLGDVFSDKITSVIKSTIDRLHENGKYVGIAAGGYKTNIVKHWSSLGPDMLAAGADFDFIRDGALNNCRNLKQIHVSGV